VLFTPWAWVNFGPFGFQPALAPQYVIYFFAGLALGAHGFDRGLLGPDSMLVRRWAFWLAGVFAAFVLWITATGLIVTGQGAALPGLQIAADLGFVLFAASACFGLAAAFLRFAAMRWPIFDSISENAYGIYLFHYVFVIWTQYALLGLALPAVVKGVIVFTVTLALSWTATAIMCRVPLGARLMRGKQRELARST
jgi:surface polysaccharide O-acyltransferase-like enzyme